MVGAAASVVGAGIAIWQASVAKKNAKIVLEVKDDIRNKNKSLVLTKLNGSTKELIEKLIRIRGKEKTPSDIKKLIESYFPDLSESVGVLKKEEKETLSSQSLTTTIFKQFVVYIEDLRRGFAIEQIKSSHFSLRGPSSFS